MAFTVGELAKLTGITVRTLHHYDQIGLVQPSDRSRAGYRLYADGDVLRLQQVLMYRELGVPLDEIPAAIADPQQSLAKHREVLLAKRARIDAMLSALDLAQRYQGAAMTNEDVKKLFDGYAEEAEQRWSETPEFKESARRTKQYGKTEWESIRREADGLYERLAELLREGAPPSDARVRGVVEAHRSHIDRWFYPCSAEMHQRLAALYVGDPRFAANFEKVAPGLAQFIHDAIVG